jgi:hypothetical protein
MAATYRIRKKAEIRSLAIERRLHPSLKPTFPTIEEQSLRASEQVLSDTTLEPGDVVVTSKGSFRFKEQDWTNGGRMTSRQSDR